MITYRNLLRARLLLLVRADKVGLGMVYIRQVGRLRVGSKVGLGLI